MIAKYSWCVYADPTIDRLSSQNMVGQRGRLAVSYQREGGGKTS